MSTKNQNTTPTPESVFAAIAQSAEPLTIKDLVSVSATWSRPVLNGIVSQLQRENKIEVIGEAPARFRAIAAGNVPATNPAPTQSKPSGNVVSITPKMAGKPQQNEQVEQNTPAQPLSAQNPDDLLARLVQQLKSSPAPIPEIEDEYGDEATRMLIKTLDERHLIVHHRILNTDTIELSPKGEEFYLSLEKAAPSSAGEQSAAGVNQASEDDKQSSSPSSNANSEKASAAAPNNQTANVEAEQPVRRKPGRPKGSKSKPKEGAAAAKGKDKSATPKSATAAANAGANVASANTPAAGQSAQAQPAPTAPAAQDIPAQGAAPASDFNTQLLALLNQAAQGAVALQMQEQTERRNQQAELANDVAEISDLMLELGKRLKTLSENLIKP